MMVGTTLTGNSGIIYNSSLKKSLSVNIGFLYIIATQSLNCGDSHDIRAIKCSMFRLGSEYFYIIW